jgi:hypothetical protein
LLRWLKSLFKQPEPAGPPEPVRVFGISDQPLTRDDVARDEDAWRIDFQEERSVRLFEVEEPGVEQCLLTYRAQVRTANAQGRVYLEMWCRVAGRGEFFSKGIHHAVEGTTDWASYEIPFFLRRGQRPDLIKLNVVSEGPGTVWIKDLELLRTPLK